ncbi:Uncharacterised protein [Salmonella enterica subsp. enterica serovar Typhi]|nr:Uncharacterised protein [Salmonella enterica subsp. enterica serovar Typhi]
MGGEVTDRAAIAAAALSFRIGNQLHGAYFRRAAQGAHVHAGAIGVQRVEIVTQFAHYPGNQMHHVRIAVNFGQIGNVATARRTDARQVIARQIDQHQMFGKLFLVGTHVQLNTAVEISVQRTIGAATAWTGTRDGVNLNLTAGGVIFQRAFRRRAEKREIIILHKEHIRAGVALFQHVVGSQRRRAGQ